MSWTAGYAAERLRSVWNRHGNAVLLVMAAWMAVTGFLRLRYGFHLLVGVGAGVDMKTRAAEVQQWFFGAQVYGVLEYAEYPPASYMMLWPMVGWLPRPAANWLWGALLAASIAVLVVLCVRESGASTWQQRLFVALLPLPLYATEMTAWYGQLSVQVTALLLVGLLLLHQRPASWPGDVLAGCLLLLSLVKPTVSAPFFWLVVFVPSRIRPAALVVGGYLLLTWAALSFQQESAATVVQQWLALAGSPLSVLDGSSNVHKWLALAGLESMLAFVSLALLAGLGVWAMYHRSIDIWLLLGVTALVARLWTDHRPHDDFLLLIPMIGLFRLASDHRLDQGARTVAALIFGALLLAGMAPQWLVAPGTWHLAPDWVHTPALSRLTQLHEVGQTALWLGTLGFLLHLARLERAAQVVVSPHPPSAPSAPSP
jgi:hypothetical protein